MNILICNERFLFRFGLDRVLLLLGRHLKKQGHSVNLIANRFDEFVVSEFDTVTTLPTNAESPLLLNEYSESWIETNWNKIFVTNPDIVVIGGWPFFTAIKLFRKKNIKTIFIDPGAVPKEGYAGLQLEIFSKLSQLRKENLKYCNRVISISNFIKQTQSIVDAIDTPIASILLGANHLEYNLWNADKSLNQTEVALNKIAQLKKKDGLLILNLGRWEFKCYKNSEASIQLLDIISKKVKNVFLLILAKSNELIIPKHLKEKVIPIGFPDDQELNEIMKLADLGVSVSLWEGFNLPLAEMQWLEKPVLVFNIGAHPEVVIDPWFLCKDLDDMADKTLQVLSKNQLPIQLIKGSIEKFKQKFLWENSLNQYEQEIIKTFLEDDSKNTKLSKINEKYIFFIDVTNSSKDTANSGVVRVTRRLSKELQARITIHFLVWDPDRNSYYFPNELEYKLLSQYNGPTKSSYNYLSTPERKLYIEDVLSIIPTEYRWLLLTETILEKNGAKIRYIANKYSMMIASIFYDAIPVLYPELCKDEIIRENHFQYMVGLSESDMVIPISNYSGECLSNFWIENQIHPTTIISNLLPGEFGGSARNFNFLQILSPSITILCVSTLEPRKNHKSLVEAFNIITNQNPTLNWTLNLVGNRYSGSDDIFNFIQVACKKNSKIKYHGVVDDQTLTQMYCDSTFTVYPSIIEGFGMPILESIWNGRPCICNENGVMKELALDGGCITVDVNDSIKLADIIYQLGTDKELYSKLIKEATNRKMKTWKEYSEEFLLSIDRVDTIQRVNKNFKKTEQINNKKTYTIESEKKIMIDHSKYFHWDEALYTNCLLENWQMNESERLSLLGVLSRIKPNCSIEIGTYMGGSLSLISQYSKAVFSIDIDPSIPQKFKQFDNVSFFTGTSKTILPLLFEELDKQDMPINFILIDGDHSYNGVKSDINLILNYKPKEPLMVLMHDSMNPDCRRGMLDADWNKSLYAHYVDIDFVPGRIVEHGGGGHGELWGGLGMFYMLPIARENELIIKKSSQWMFEILSTSTTKEI